MSEVFIIELLVAMVRTISLLVGPLIAAVILVAILSNVLQTVTQIKDPALAFVPKIGAALVVLVVGAPWFLQLLRAFARNVLSLLSRGPM